jgi:uncharacterized protein YbaA (DUF1428 family)
MARYVDGYVLPVPKRKLATYRRMARLGAKVWRDHGALEYRECVGDDLKLKWGVSFLKQFKAKPSETIVFSWIVFKSRKDRDRINANVMKDPRLANMNPENMPFDMKRMAVGGFKTIVDA